MSSELQQIASRANGAKSQGPITEEGKQASSQNSLNHGFNSKRIVLPGESQDEFDELLAAYLDEHQPETPTERTLIENMAIARWRQHRVWALETAGLANEIAAPAITKVKTPTPRPSSPSAPCPTTPAPSNSSTVTTPDSSASSAPR
jgi:hypothetical protein